MNDEPLPATVPAAPSKGQRLIAAYRAERRNRRTGARTMSASAHAGLLTETDATPHLTAPEAELASARSASPAPSGNATGSVFASLVKPPIFMPIGPAFPRDVSPCADAETDSIPPVTPPCDEPVAGPEPFDPPLAEIGFGPGMIIRLSQIGIRTTGDLAKAKSAELRASLGEISRIVDVEAWIASAQQTMASPASAN